MELPKGPLPSITSNRQDLLLDNQSLFDATTAHAYADSDWATCVKTRRSFGGTCIWLIGSTIAYKCKFQPTVAGSTIEAEFMAAYKTGKMILFIGSVLWGLNVPQKRPRYYLRTTTAAPQWVTLRNLLPEPGTWILSTHVDTNIGFLQFLVAK